MKRKTVERTPEEIEQLSRKNQQQYSLVAAVIWTVFSVIWIVLLVLSIVDGDPILQILLQGVCAVCTAVSAVLHFIRWRRMRTADPTPDGNALDREDK